MKSLKTPLDAAFFVGSFLPKFPYYGSVAKDMMYKNHVKLSLPFRYYYL